MRVHRDSGEVQSNFGSSLAYSYPTPITCYYAVFVAFIAAVGKQKPYTIQQIMLLGVDLSSIDIKFNLHHLLCIKLIRMTHTWHKEVIFIPILNYYVCKSSLVVTATQKDEKSSHTSRELHELLFIGWFSNNTLTDFTD